MNKKRWLLMFLSLITVTMLCSCSKDFEGSGSKEAASAEQLAMRLEDTWQKPIEKKRDRLEGDYLDGKYSAVAYGMEGTITLGVSIKDNVLTVDSIKQEYETQSVGGYEGIRDGVYANQLEATQGTDIDGIAGATVTTAAIKNALRDILKQAEKTNGSVANATLKDGEYSATKKGFGGDIVVSIVVKDGKLADVKVVGDKETPGQGGLEAIQDGTYVNKLLEKGSSDIDSISGATITSNAVQDAMADALKQAR